MTLCEVKSQYIGSCQQVRVQCISFSTKLLVSFNYSLHFKVQKSLFHLESIQGIRKRPIYRFEDTIVWERWYIGRFEINIDYRLIQCIRGFCSSPLPILKLSLQVPRIDSNRLIFPILHKNCGFTYHLDLCMNTAPATKWTNISFLSKDNNSKTICKERLSTGNQDANGQV